MGIPDHLTCLLRNLHAGQEATVRTGHGTTDWFQIGKGIFAVFYQLPIAISIPDTVPNAGAITKILGVIPYVMTILVLIVVSLFNKRETQPPSALGLTYFREDR